MPRSNPYDTRPGDDERERDADAVYVDCDAVIDLVRAAFTTVADRKRYLGQFSTCPGGHDTKMCDSGLEGLDELIKSLEAERDDVAERVMSGERSAA